MTPEGRRAARRLAFTAISAAAGYAVSGASARQALRVPLGVLAVAAVGNLGLQVKTASKTYAVESRFNNLINNGGSFGGNIVVNGNHSVTGTVSAGGTISNTSGNINTNGNVNAPGGNVSGGTLTSSGDVQATSGTVHAGGVGSSGTITAAGNITTSGGFNGSNTTGVGGQGSVLGDKFTDTIPGGSAFTASAATWLGDFQSAYNGGISDLQSAITRINDLLSALG